MSDIGHQGREPILHTVPILELRPTQITVGMREVEQKRAAWRKKTAAGGGTGRDKAGEFLGSHMIPVVLGPKGHHYVIDHHHLTRALHEEGVADILVSVVADYSGLDKDCFWFVLDCHNLMHPFDAQGVRQGHEMLPKTVAELIDDPFRSLAGELRRTGGFAKDITPFSEFLWADFLRRRLDRRDIVADFEAALASALSLAKGREAGYLPGWCGPVPR